MDGGWAPPGGRATGAGARGGRGGSRWDRHRPKPSVILAKTGPAVAPANRGGAAGVPTGDRRPVLALASPRRRGYAGRCRPTEGWEPHGVRRGPGERVLPGAAARR